MKIGISSGSLYPMHTEDAFSEIANLGVKNVELFFSSMRETKGSIFKKILDIKNEHNMNVLSVHPLSSPFESVYLFGDYDRRIDDMTDIYKSYFEIMNILGTKYFILHGAIKSSNCSDERYYERYSLLYEIGRKFDVYVAQENVSYCKSGDLDFLCRMKKQLGENVRFTVDMKQALRSGSDIVEHVNALGNSVVHLHISDSNDDNDCLPVGKGNFKFEVLFKALKETQYKGNMILELYSNNYSEISELSNSVKLLENLEAQYKVNIL